MISLRSRRQESPPPRVARAFRLVPHLLDAGSDRLGAIPLEKLGQSPLSQAASRQLRAQIAETGFREAHVVGDDLPDIFVQLAAAVDLDRAELEPLFIDFRRLDGAEADAPAADVEPVGPYRREGDQLAVSKAGSVNDDIV